MTSVPSVWIPVPRPAGSVELRCGVLYSGCQCVKRDGLQQDCPRTECQGRPECMAFPAPICIPSGNAPQQHLRSPTPKSPDKRTFMTNDRNHEQNTKHKSHKKSRAKMFLDMAREGYIENPCTPKRIHGFCNIHREIK